MATVPWGGGLKILSGAKVLGHYASRIHSFVILTTGSAFQLCDAEVGQDFCNGAIALRYYDSNIVRTLWPSGLRRWLEAPVRKGAGSNATGVNAKYLEPGTSRFLAITQIHPKPLTAAGTRKGI